jgi:pyrroloquinoline quinone (PQQ) biosynthesis protein C
MAFFEHLKEATAPDRSRLLSTPIIADCLAGRVSVESYGEFLVEAYHHVKHTVPLLMACGSRLPERLEWLREGLAAYIEEEYGHEQWILNDLEALGWKRSAALARGPRVETELMVAYAYDTVSRRNPAGLLGMVFVLEGTSVEIATRAAQIIMQQLELPRRAFSYLLSHGSLDAAHIGHFESLVNRFDDDTDKAAVVHCARVVYRLYGDMFRALPRAIDSTGAESSTTAPREAA